MADCGGGAPDRRVCSSTMLVPKLGRTAALTLRDHSVRWTLDIAGKDEVKPDVLVFHRKIEMTTGETIVWTLGRGGLRYCREKMERGGVCTSASSRTSARYEEDMPFIAGRDW